MSTLPRSRLVNPHLGRYIGIAASALVAMALVLLLLEGMGTPVATLGLAIAVGPIVLYAAIALAASTTDPADLRCAGQRVPAFFNGLIMTVTALGGAGLLAFTGELFLIGFDALCLFIGLVAGLVVLGVLIAPFVRKCGAPTPAAFLHLRFRSTSLRVLVAATLVVPLILIIAAEVRVAASVAMLMTGRSLDAMVLLVAALLVIVLVPGGMRSHTWSATAKSIAALLAILTPVTLLAVVVTNLPVPQLSHGIVMRSLGRTEILHSVAAAPASMLAFDLAGISPASISARFAAPFVAVGTVSFVCTSLMIMLGIAASPGLIARCATTPSVYEARKSVGWAVLLLAVALITLSAVATFLRDTALGQIIGADAARLPGWFRDWLSLGFAETTAASGRVELSSVQFRRDQALFALPLAAGQPRALTAIALAGALAAALAAAAQSALALGLAIAEDIVWGTGGEPATPARRIFILRIAMLVAVLIGVMVVLFVELDPFQHVLWALCLIGPTLFPVMALSIWWKRINLWGALASVSVGFITGMLAIVLGEAGLLALPLPVAAVLATAASIIAALGLSLLTPAGARSELETVRDLRVPGGETIYDRELRAQRSRRRTGP